MDQAARILAVLAIITALSEMLSRLLVLFLGTNLPLFHISTMIELFMCTLYFIVTINVRHKMAVLIVSAILILLAGIGNIVFLQPIVKLNTYMLLFEAYCIMAMSLLALFYIMRDESVSHIFRYPHFWFWTLILTLWATNFCYWGFYQIMGNEKVFRYFYVAANYQIFLNTVAYAGIAFVFTMNYKKKLWQEQQ